MRRWLLDVAGIKESKVDKVLDVLDDLFSRVPVSSLVEGAAEFLLGMGENLFLVILFTLYLLFDPRKGSGTRRKPEKPSRTDELILEYIKRHVKDEGFTFACAGRTPGKVEAVLADVFADRPLLGQIDVEAWQLLSMHAQV